MLYSGVQIIQYPMINIMFYEIDRVQRLCILIYCYRCIPKLYGTELSSNLYCDSNTNNLLKISGGIPRVLLTTFTHVLPDLASNISGYISEVQFVFKPKYVKKQCWKNDIEIRIIKGANHVRTPLLSFCLFVARENVISK